MPDQRQDRADGAASAATDDMPRVASLMRTKVPWVAPEAPVATVARVLAESSLPGVPVLVDGQIVGIVTEADLIARHADVEVPTIIPFLDAFFLADAGRDFDEEVRHVLAVTARDLMTSPVYNIRESATLGQIATLMLERRVNPVPVVDADDRLVGIVSRADLVRVIARLETDAPPTTPDAGDVPAAGNAPDRGSAVPER